MSRENRSRAVVTPKRRVTLSKATGAPLGALSARARDCRCVGYQGHQLLLECRDCDRSSDTMRISTTAVASKAIMATRVLILGLSVGAR